MIVFTKRDKECANTLYQDMADAVAAAVVRREATIATVFVAAYQHRFGIDFTAHATRDLAELRLADVATRECARDPELRDRVVKRFGAWPAQQMKADELDELVGDWSALMEHEALWIVECDVETNESRSEQMRACTVPFPESHCPATTRTSTEDSAMNSAMNSATYSATDSTSSTTAGNASTYTNPEDQPAIGYASSD
jgi:hypothetical protein